jgi:endo-1,4-beta-xylanase
MRRLTPLLRPLALSLVLACGCGHAEASSDESDLTGGLSQAQFVRPVVLATAPLALSNPQGDAVTWPVWGGAFTLAKSVSVHVALEAKGASASGLVFGSRGDPGAEKDESVAIELVARGGAWVLRELAGAKTVQELRIEAPASADFVVTFASAGKSVKVTSNGKDYSMTTKGALAPSAGIYVHLEPAAQLSLRELALTEPLPVASALGTPLRRLAAERGISIGSATDVWPPLHDSGFESLLGEQFDTAAPTEFYWATTRGEDKDYYFVPSDLMVNYATVHKQKLTGYFLMWDFELPQWVNKIAETGDKAALGATVDDHIKTLVSRYKGRMNAWVVANEAIWGPDETNGKGARFGDSIWNDVLGPEYIERAFKVAHEADPQAVLIYNETGAETLGEKSDFLHKMASDFVARGVPIGGIGLQFHLNASKLPKIADVKANMERLAALGLDLYITELDVSLADLKTTEAEKQKVQAGVYTDVLRTCLAIPKCRSYTVFGFTDRYGWDELGDATPLVFDKDYHAKPAFFAVQSELAKPK